MARKTKQDDIDRQQWQIQELQRKNEKYLMALIQIKTSAWDEKQIRAKIGALLKEIIDEP